MDNMSKVILLLLSSLALTCLSIHMNSLRDNFAALPKSKLLKAYADQMYTRRTKLKTTDKSTPATSKSEDESISMIQSASRKGVPAVERNFEGIPTRPVQAKRQILSGGSGLKKIRKQGDQPSEELVNPNRLRIIAGTAKGKKIESPDVYLIMQNMC